MQVLLNVPWRTKLPSMGNHRAGLLRAGIVSHTSTIPFRASPVPNPDPVGECRFNPVSVCAWVSRKF